MPKWSWTLKRLDLPFTTGSPAPILCVPFPVFQNFAINSAITSGEAGMVCVVMDVRATWESADPNEEQINKDC